MTRLTCEHTGLEVAGLGQGGGRARAGELEGRRGSEHHGGAGAGAGVQAGVRPGVLGVRGGGQPRGQAAQVTGEAPQLDRQPTLLAPATALGI